MARKLNKNLVGILTLAVMATLMVISVLLVQNLPGQDPEVYAAQAIEHEAKGEFNLAARTYQRAFQKDPAKNPEYLVLAAKSAVKAGSLEDLAQARTLLFESLVRNSSLKSALIFSTELEFEIAELFGGKLQWGSVREKATRLLESDSESPLGHHALGVAYLRLRGEDPSHEKKGEEGLTRALELDPTNVDIMRSLTEQLWRSAMRADAAGRATEAESIRQTVESIVASGIERCGDTEEASELKQLQATYGLYNGRVEEGLVALEALAEAETEGTACRMQLGRLYAGFTPSPAPRDLNRAKALFAKALEVDPTDGLTYKLLGRTLRFEGKTEEESALYLRGLAAIPYEKNFRSFRNNTYRVDFMTELFLADLNKIDEARRAEDETARLKALDRAEEWVAKLQEEVDEKALSVRFMRASLLYAQREYVSATKEAEAASRTAGADHHFPLQRLLAELYVRRQQWGAARESLEKAMILRPGSPRLYIRLGQVHLSLGEPAKALQYLNPGRPAALVEYLQSNRMAQDLLAKAYEDLGQPDRAMEVIRRSGRSSAEEALREANVLLGEGRYEEVERKIKSVLADEPENVKATEALARLYGMTDRIEEARSTLAPLRTKDPENEQYRRLDRQLMLYAEKDEASRERMKEAFFKEEKDPFRRALSLYDLYRNQKRDEEASVQLEEAERLRPDDARVIEHQLRSALVAKDWAKADKYAAKHAELNIDGTEGKIAQGRIALAKGQKGDVEQAIELIRAGLEAYPSYSMGWAHLADAYVRAGRQREAKTVLERALEIDPTNGFANRAMAQFAVRDGDEEAQAKYVVLAAKFLPNDPWVRSQNQILKEKENPEKGIAQREKLRRENPDNLENLVLLARLYGLRSVGDYDKAAEVYREAMRVSGGDVGMAREFSTFLGREDVQRPAEGEKLLKDLLTSEEDISKKAQIAVYLGQFYETQKTLATADRHFRLAVSLDPSIDVLVLAAEYYARTNRLQRAQEYYERALTAMDDSSTSAASTRSRIIGLLLARGDLEEAKKRIDDYIQRYPDDAQGRVFEGAYHRMGGDIKKSKEAFDAFLEKHPDDALALWQRGQLYKLMGRWQSAINDFKRAKVFSPNGLEYQHRIALADALIEVERADEAIAELKSILDERPDENSVAKALVDAYQRVRPPRYADAESLIYSFMARYPDDPKWPALLGGLGLASGDLNRAIEGYEAAAETARYRGSTVKDLFAAYKTAGHAQDIIRFSDERLSARLLDEMDQALSLLAWAYARIGDPEKSAETYDRALDAAGEDFGAYTRIVVAMNTTLGGEVVLARARTRLAKDPENVGLLRSLVFLLHVNRKPEEAIEYCNRIIQFAVHDDDRLFGELASGMFSDSLERHEDAKGHYEAALRIDANQPRALNNLAYLLIEHMDNAAEALPYAERAYRVQPTDSNVLDTYGWALAKNKRFGDAAGMLLRALEIQRNDYVAMYHLGIVNEQMGERSDAIHWLKAAKDAADARKQEDKRYLPKIIEALKEIEAAGG